jgi:hypothetical protein
MPGLIGLLGTTALLVALALPSEANAQVAITIGGPPPVCSYGYYGYAPYSCAPVGYYGSGYFYNGVFVGMGPWAGWGYNHGWGGHRFVAAGGGRYNGGFVGYHGDAHHAAVVHTSGNGAAHRSSYANDGHAATHNSQPHAVAHNSQPHGTPHAAAPGGGSHAGGGESHGGGEHR